MACSCSSSVATAAGSALSVRWLPSSHGLTTAPYGQRSLGGNVRDGHGTSTSTRPATTSSTAASRSCRRAASALLGTLMHGPSRVLKTHAEKPTATGVRSSVTAPTRRRSPVPADESRDQRRRDRFEHSAHSPARRALQRHAAAFRLVRRLVTPTATHGGASMPIGSSLRSGGFEARSSKARARRRGLGLESSRPERRERAQLPREFCVRATEVGRRSENRKLVGLDACG